ncbi:MAG: thymidine phosphorylase, partial [Candidatus Diapherotrites archaeon]|nr:thymidine phosphorylase [Candidatus Diapherotrites archaeon]
YIRGFNDDETVALTEAIVDSGESVVIEKEPVVDKHCIGGIPNNRTTMLVVPILTSLGFYVPKLSSRAITSPAGTADTMEVLAPVDLDAETVKEITESVGGVMAWGGGTRIAAADDKLIAIRRPLSLDPRGMLLASILAKKKAVSSQYVLIDIPVGPEAKIPTVRKGEELAEQFITIGTRLGMHMKAVITDGSAPIGRGVGPVLEAKDVLEILMGKGPDDLRKKGTELAAHIISFVKGTEWEDALRIADEQIRSGAALGKFREIIAAQGGDPDVKPEDLKPGKYSETIYADRDGRVIHVSNHAVAHLARAAGAPFQKGAGIYLHVRVGDRVRKGDPLYTVYSDSQKLLKDALGLGEEVLRLG